MTTACPKCHHVRPADTAAPAWQCPSCGVAYAKVSAAAASAQRQPRGPADALRPAVAPAGRPWRAVVLAAAVVASLAFGYQASQQHQRGDGALSSLGGSLGSDASEADLRALASTTRPGDVVMYTTTGCPNCAAARSWMAQYGFAFSECDAAVQRACADELKARRVQGVPYLLVKGRPMDDGFDSDQFVALLAKR